MVKGKLVKLQLWDTAGQERFSVVTGNYYRNSDGFIFVYDATNRTSFEHIHQWLDQVCGAFRLREFSFLDALAKRPFATHQGGSVKRVGVSKLRPERCRTLY